MEKRKKMQYIAGSFRTPGQDGSFFNRSVLQGQHPLRNALYRTSDHLPVALHVAVDARPSVGRSGQAIQLSARLWPNPVAGNFLTVEPHAATGTVSWRVLDLLGREWAAGELTAPVGQVPVPNLPTGVYALELTDGAGHRGVHRFVRN